MTTLRGTLGPVHRDLVAYGEVLGRETGLQVDPAKLIAPMLERSMLTDRAVLRARQENERPSNPAGSG